MSNSRTANSIRNSSVAILSQLLISLTTFVTRTVFVHYLDKVYLGINGLFSDILTLLSLAELGFGTAITYSLYRPISLNDYCKSAALVTLYRKVYSIIGIIVLMIGLSLLPYLDFFISGLPDIPELSFIYLLYLLNTSVSYFFVYKRSVLIATQNSYIISLAQIISKLTQCFFQILVLFFWKNFVLYLIIQIICTVLNNYIVSLYVDCKFKFIKQYRKEKIDIETKNEITRNVLAMFVNKFSSVIVTSTDNILISKYVSTLMLGVYSNYSLFTMLIRTIFTRIFESVTGSVGNLLAIDNGDKPYKTYQKIWFINFWLIGFSAITFFISINSFIRLWIGDDYILNNFIVFLISLNTYTRFIRNTSLTFIDTYGLFDSVKWNGFLDAIINIIASLTLLKVFKLGLPGVLLGTFISDGLTCFWFEPYILYKKKFKKSLKDYFLRYFQYLGTVVVTGSVLYIVTSLLVWKNIFFDFISNIILCCVLINFSFYIVFRKSAEYSECKAIFSKLLRSILKKN